MILLDLSATRTADKFLEEKDITEAESVSFTVQPVSDASKSVLVLKDEARSTKGEPGRICGI